MLVINTFLLLIFLSYTTLAQVVINQQHMPQANNTYVVYEKQMIFLSPTQYETAGANQTWDFTNLSSNIFHEEEFIHALSSQINPACLIVFNNIFDQPYFSNLAQRLPDFSDPFDSIQVENVFAMYKVNQHGYIQTGRSATINGLLPLCAKNVPPDTIYKFPLQYGQNRTSSSKYSFSIPGSLYYEQAWTRTSIVDAWGTIKTPAGIFQALRVKMNLSITDSIYYNSLGMGLSIPSSKTLFIWLSNTQNYPVFIIERTPLSYLNPKVFWLSINTTNLIDNYTSSNDTLPFVVYPLETQSQFKIVCMHNDCNFILFNLYGQKLYSFNVSCNSIINLKNLANGFYFLKHTATGKIILLNNIK